MIIDAHAHLVAPPELYVYKANLQSNHGAHGKGSPGISPERLLEFATQNVEIMDAVGTDVQLLSPRPYMLMHSERPDKIVRWWVEWNNDLIARTVDAYPDRFRGIASLPQSPQIPVTSWLDELDRCVTDLGFVGLLLNPDPYEGLGESPPLSDEYWYPLYERMVQLDVPALIHSAACRNDRESYSEHFVTEESIAVLALTKSRVFLDFPDLKIVVSHGGGSVPYQIGRWKAARQHPRLGAADALREPFEDSLRRLYFDTVLHEKASLELLLRTVGADRCLFGTEKPGSGTAKDPSTGRDFDELRPLIEEIDWLGDDERLAIFSGNARRIHNNLPTGKA
jgi:predicted TIM-barrel fold metal-dependent hydrolase